jgi:pentatricopeptide repeat protein
MQMMKELEIRGARRQALQVFRFLQKKPEFGLKEHNCVTIISILGREGKLGLAREIFEGMTNNDVTPSAHSYTALLSG